MTVLFTVVLSSTVLAFFLRGLDPRPRGRQACPLVLAAILIGGCTAQSPVQLPTPSASGSSAAMPCGANQVGEDPGAHIETAPDRSSVGTGYVLSGVIRSGSGCAPISGARVVYWLQSPQGEYDDAHRGAVRTDERGAYRIETYPLGAPGADHIHLQVSAAGFHAQQTEYIWNPGSTGGTLDLTLDRE